VYQTSLQGMDANGTTCLFKATWGPLEDNSTTVGDSDSDSKLNRCFVGEVFTAESSEVVVSLLSIRWRAETLPKENRLSDETLQKESSSADSEADEGVSADLFDAFVERYML
jgi:hypothetical protein